MKHWRRELDPERIAAAVDGLVRDSRDMKIAQQVKRVSWVETPGELGVSARRSRN